MLTPDRPEIITSEIEVVGYTQQMNPRDAAKLLIAGNLVLIEDYFRSGLRVLNQLKKILKKRVGDTFSDQRKFRKEYRETSHRLLLRISNHKIDAKNSPRIGWLKILYPDVPYFLISFPSAQGLNSSWQWYKKGIYIEVLQRKIHPYYGTYFPTRFDHLELFKEWLSKYKGAKSSAVDVGVGSGVLSYLLLDADFAKVFATDINPNAIIGVDQESKRLGWDNRLELRFGDLFADLNARSDLVVFNPPWMPATHELSSGIDRAIYYESDLFRRFFERVSNYLLPEGRIALLFSNLSQVVEESDNPIWKELTVSDEFYVEDRLEKSVKPSSKRTRRRDWRKDERVELWIIKPREEPVV